ncbi:peptidase inhibitor family I36 protein [Salininema proteolyticum]|uniref:Peptidase inhibitor family I36 protein n=1 Tax=Salininema proteolyticum TaxID=1607685 RepID=A0ABV8U4V7_9ACTN
MPSLRLPTIGRRTFLGAAGATIAAAIAIGAQVLTGTAASAVSNKCPKLNACSYQHPNFSGSSLVAEYNNAKYPSFLDNRTSSIDNAGFGYY